MADSEKMISEKKKEVEKLVMEMKDANLESLSITPSEEIRTLLEGKTGMLLNLGFSNLFFIAKVLLEQEPTTSFYSLGD